MSSLLLKVDDENDDFLDEVVEFGDGTQYKVTHEESVAAAAEAALAPSTLSGEPVRKQDRFAEDFDRSWPQSQSSQQHQPSSQHQPPHQRPFQPSHPHPPSSHHPFHQQQHSYKSHSLEKRPSHSHESFSSSSQSNSHISTANSSSFPRQAPSQSPTSSTSVLPTKPRPDDPNSRKLFNERSNKFESSSSLSHPTPQSQPEISPAFQLLQKSRGSENRGLPSRSLVGGERVGFDRPPLPDQPDGRALPPHLAMASNSVGASSTVNGPPPRSAWAIAREGPKGGSPAGGGSLASRVSQPHLTSLPPPPPLTVDSSRTRTSFSSSDDAHPPHSHTQPSHHAIGSSRPLLGGPRRLSNNTSATYQLPLLSPSNSPTLPTARPYLARRPSSEAPRRLSVDPSATNLADPARRPSVNGDRPMSPQDLTTMQKEEMVSAAERARKRREAEEAERLAARERAKKKADELAAKVKVNESTLKPAIVEPKMVSDQESKTTAPAPQTTVPVPTAPGTSSRSAPLPSPAITSTPSVPQPAVPASTSSTTTTHLGANSAHPTLDQKVPPVGQHSGIPTPSPPQITKNGPIPDDVQVVDYSELSSLAPADAPIPDPKALEGNDTAISSTKRSRMTSVDFFEDKQMKTRFEPSRSKPTSVESVKPTGLGGWRKNFGGTSGSTPSPFANTSGSASSVPASSPTTMVPAVAPSPVSTSVLSESSLSSTPIDVALGSSDPTSPAHPVQPSPPSSIRKPSPPPPGLRQDSVSQTVITAATVPSQLPSSPTKAAYRDVDISSIDDVMSRIKSEMDRREAEKAAAATTSQNTTRAHSGTLPLKPQFSSSVNPFAASQLSPSTSVSVKTPTSTSPPALVASPLRPASIEEVTTVPPRPSSPPPAWKLYSVHLPTDTRRRPPADSSKLKVVEREPDDQAPEVFSWGRGKSGGTDDLIAEEVRVQLSKGGPPPPAPLPITLPVAVEGQNQKATLLAIKPQQPASLSKGISTSLPTKPAPSPSPSASTPTQSISVNTTSKHPSLPANAGAASIPTTNILPLPPKPVPALAVVAPMPTSKSARPGRAMEEISWRRKAPVESSGSEVTSQGTAKLDEEEGKKLDESAKVKEVSTKVAEVCLALLIIHLLYAQNRVD